MEDSTTEIYHRFYLKYAPALFRFAEKYVSAFISEDIVHDVFLEVWDKSIYHLPESEVRMILYTVVKNACIDSLRKSVLEKKYIDVRTHKLMIDELENFESPETVFMYKDLLTRVREEIDELPEQRRVIFNLFYNEDLKVLEISERLNLSKRTVENQLYRALLFLRKKCFILRLITLLSITAHSIS